MAGRAPRHGQAGREGKGLAPLTPHKMQMHCPDLTTGKQGEIIVPPRPASAASPPPLPFPAVQIKLHFAGSVFLGMAEEEKIDFLENWVQNLLTAELISYFPPLSPAGIHLPDNSRGRQAISTCWCHAPSSLCVHQWITVAMNK